MENAAQFTGVVAVEMTGGADPRTVGTAGEMAAVNGGGQIDRVELNIAVPFRFDASAHCLVAEVDSEIGISDAGNTITANCRITIVFDDALIRHISGEGTLAEDVVGIVMRDVAEAAVAVIVAADQEILVADAVNLYRIAADIGKTADVNTTLLCSEVFAVNVYYTKTGAIQGFGVTDAVKCYAVRDGECGTVIA